ncbi:hypothetical protein EP342_01305 [bacterium]|nr:MAG: hypothetical protein EP342_01305 [bacterium]
MKNMKNNLDDLFPQISIDDWKKEAQESIGNIPLDSLLTKQLTDNISINAIYDKSLVDNYYNLEYHSPISESSNSISLDQFTDLPLESDLEIAFILTLIKQNGYNSVEIDLRIDTNFFLTISKFRAMRYLLANNLKIPFRLIAKSPNHNKSITDNKNNLIRLTTEAMSAILGGADEVRLTPYNSTRENDDFGKRITENIKIILENESYLSFVNDPLSGAYLIERMTQAIIESQEEYQIELSKLSDMDKIIAFIDTKANQHFEKLKKKLDTQEKKLIGVNIYQNPIEKLGNIDFEDSALVNTFEELKVEIDNLNPKIYIANFENKHQIQKSLIIAMNTYNIKFQVSGKFELVEDAYNSIKLFDPDLVVINANSDVQRNLKNMLPEYNLLSIDQFTENSITTNIKTITEKINSNS